MKEVCVRGAVALALLGQGCDGCLRAWNGTGPLFWMHIPKTGTTFRAHLARYACPRRTEDSNDLRVSARSISQHVEEGACTRPIDEESFRAHVSFRPEFCGAAVAFLREPRRRLLSAFYFTPSQRMSCYLMGVPNGEDCQRIRSLPDELGILAYASELSARNVQTKMFLGYGRFDKIKDKRLNVSEAKARLRRCFPFVGLTDRWRDSLELFDRTMPSSSATPNLRLQNLRTNVGRYNASYVRVLDDYRDADTRVYRAAVRLFEERRASLRCGGYSM